MGALASSPCEALLADMLEDDRIVKRYQTLRVIAMTELKHAAGISEVVMQVFANLCSCSTCDLRSSTIAAANCSIGFVNDRVFDAVEDWPWCIAKGGQGCQFVA